MAGLSNLSLKNRLRDRSSGSKSRQATGQRFSGPIFRQESRTGFKTETGYKTGPKTGSQAGQGTLFCFKSLS